MNLLGGVRARCFFADMPDKAPVLSKVPLVRWRRSYAYLSSTHVLLPTALNRYHDEGGREKPCGVLLHTKFLPGIGSRAREDKARGQQYVKGPEHLAYYDALSRAPDMWTQESRRYAGWRQLVDTGADVAGRLVTGPAERKPQRNGERPAKFPFTRANQAAINGQTRSGTLSSSSPNGKEAHRRQGCATRSER